ncbi:MAG: GTP cyclohydrolase I FolE2 [Candidatus Cloacimonetes bacterium]|nr:GTP cyclohydrolase I FolE2 [Candidatus Cloacimonadota bacterium]
MKDIQNQTDHRRITVDKVGVKGIHYPIILEDRALKTQHTIATLNIYVELPHSKRGTHMSRFIEILNRFHENNLISQLPQFLAEIKRSLKAAAAYVDIRFPFFIRKQAPVSKISSLVCYDCHFQASLKDVYVLIIGVDVPVTTLCPCSKELSAVGAHNQRSIISIKVRYEGFVWLEELIDLAESTCSCEIYSLLKRCDEKYVTDKAFANPMFVEDIVRDLTLKLKQDKRITWFHVESENFESIHSHNAYAMKQS